MDSLSNKRLSLGNGGFFKKWQKGSSGTIKVQQISKWLPAPSMSNEIPCPMKRCSGRPVCHVSVHLAWGGGDNMGGDINV